MRVPRASAPPWVKHPVTSFAEPGGGAVAATRLGECVSYARQGEVILAIGLIDSTAAASMDICI